MNPTSILKIWLEKHDIDAIIVLPDFDKPPRPNKSGIEFAIESNKADRITLFKSK